MTASTAIDPWAKNITENKTDDDPCYCYLWKVPPLSKDGKQLLFSNN